MRIKAGVVGATGYAGAELVRLLTGHPQAELSLIHIYPLCQPSMRQTGKGDW